MILNTMKYDGVIKILLQKASMFESITKNEYRKIILKPDYTFSKEFQMIGDLDCKILATVL